MSPSFHYWLCPSSWPLARRWVWKFTPMTVTQTWETIPWAPVCFCRGLCLWFFPHACSHVNTCALIKDAFVPHPLTAPISLPFCTDTDPKTNLTNRFDRIVCIAGWYKLSEDTCEGVKTGLVFVLNLLCIPPLRLPSQTHFWNRLCRISSLRTTLPSLMTPISWWRSEISKFLPKVISAIVWYPFSFSFSAIETWTVTLRNV